MHRCLIVFALLGSSAIQAKDNSTLPTIGFTSSGPVSERAITIEDNGDRLVVIEKTAEGVSEVELELRVDAVIVTRKSELSDSRTVVDLPAIAKWAQNHPGDAGLVQEHFDWQFSQHTRLSADNAVILASGCGNQLQAMIDAADAMALACGGYSGGTVACASATRAYRSAKDSLMRCYVQMQ